MIVCRSQPIIPPIPGLRELSGVWTTRKATSMRSVPRSLLVLGGPAGAQLAQTVRRLGDELTPADSGEQVLAREPEPLLRRRAAQPRTSGNG